MKEIKVDQSAILKKLRIMTSSLVNSQIVGNYRSVFKGRGLEFADYRHYTPNDDASMIDWKASVKSKELLVKEFGDERNISVFFLIDVSSSMIYTSHDKLKIEYAAELVSTLSYVILNAGDGIGFALFNDKVIAHSVPTMGFKQYYKLIQTLVNPNNYGGSYNLSEAFKFTLAFLKEYSIVIVISDFIGLDDEWKKYLKMVGKKFDLIGLMVRDPNDKILPDYKGKVSMSDVYSGRQLTVNINDIRNRYTEYVEQVERDISNTFLEAHADFLELDTDKPFIKPISDLFLRRSKRIR